MFQDWILKVFRGSTEGIGEGVVAGVHGAPRGYGPCLRAPSSGGSLRLRAATGSHPAMAAAARFFEATPRFDTLRDTSTFFNLLQLSPTLFNLIRPSSIFSNILQPSRTFFNLLDSTSYRVDGEVPLGSGRTPRDPMPRLCS